MSSASHYQTLKVTRTATHEQIRRAYYEEARLWHPDRFAGKAAAEQARAETAMRAVNEAWRVLGDTERRRSYDAGLDAALRPDGGRPVEGVRTDGGVTRIDPRLLDPEFLRQRRQASVDYVDERHSVFLRYIPWFALAGLLMAIFVFTAYQGDDRPASTSPVTMAGPEIGVPAGACVRIIGGPSLLQVGCDTASAEGRVIGAHEPGGQCPAEITLREVELSNGITACLGA